MRRVFPFTAKLCAIALFATIAHAAALTPEQQVFVDRAKAALIHTLRDPSSVRWRDLYIAHDEPYSAALCGLVNAKNGFGGYTGFRPFYAVPHYGLAEIKQDDSYDSDVYWLNATVHYCSRDKPVVNIDP